MDKFQLIEKHIIMKLAVNEKIQTYAYGLHMVEKQNFIFKSPSLIAATNEKIYICSMQNMDVFLEEVHYSDIQSIYYRERILSGLETIILTNNRRISISHIEEGCPKEFMTFVQSKINKKIASAN